MTKMKKKGLAALLMAVSLVAGGYGIGVQKVSASEDISDSFDEAEVTEEDFAENSTENLAEEVDEPEEIAGEEDEDFDSSVDIETEDIAQESTEDKSEFTDGSYENEFSSQNEEAKSCGTEENTVFWNLDTNGTLKITGSGEMLNWTTPETVPWNEAKPEIKKIEIAEGTTSIGSYAFSNCENLTTITVPDSVQHIGEYAFFNCGGLSTVDIG